jgi:hypothetical protein
VPPDPAIAGGRPGGDRPEHGVAAVGVLAVAERIVQVGPPLRGVDVGLIRRIQPAGSPARFEARVSDNHHHVICRSCGRVADVDCAVGSAPCLTAVDAMGYEIDEAEVIYWGSCPECQSQTRG